MTTSKSKQPEDQQKTHEQPESSAKPEAPTEASANTSRRVPKGFEVGDSPGQQLFIGGLPGKPPGALPAVTAEKESKPTQARFWPVPKGFRVADEEEGGDQIFVGGFPCAPPKRPK